MRKNQYVGDPNIEAKVFSAVTGVKKTGDDLDKDATPRMAPAARLHNASARQL